MTPNVILEPISAVVMDYAERISAGDLDGTLAYFHDDAVLYLLGLPPEAFEMQRGKEQIRTMFEENIAGHLVMEAEVLDVKGDVVTARTTTWHDFTREIGAAPIEATAIYVIKDGKIATEAWHVSETSLAKLKAALAKTMPAEREAEPIAGSPVSELTITFAGGTCAYDGPLALQAGSVTVNMDVRDLAKEKYALTFFNLEPGKDFTDLMASTIRTAPPSWSTMFRVHEARPGDNSRLGIQVKDGPVYVVCWSSPPDLAIGALGPFIVAE